MLGIVGERLKTARQRADLSQQRLADVIGVHVMQVSKWERGAVLPSADSLDAIAGALGVSVDYLLGRSDDPAGVIAESDLSPDELRVLTLYRLRDLPALLSVITDIAHDVQQQRRVGVDEAALDKDSSGGGE